MEQKLSKRLSVIVESLPLHPGIRILEIGCGPGASAREIATRIGHGSILAIDRSAKAIQQPIAGSQTEIAIGRLSFKQAAIETFELDAGVERFDLAFAIRVGALDGRHPEIEDRALQQIAKALKKTGKLFIDGGSPLKEISLDKYRIETRL